MPRPDAQPPLLERGTAFEGLVSFQGDARIDGRLAGEVVAWGSLRIGEAGEVRARVEVDNLFVAGRLEGDAVGRERIELAATARVRGTLRAPSLVLADGCVVDGRCEAGAAADGPCEAAARR